MNMDFGANKTPVEMIKEVAFGGNYSRSNRKWYRKSWKEFDELKDIDQSKVLSLKLL